MASESELLTAPFYGRIKHAKLMEKLLGKWRQTSHKAMINGQWCNIIPCEDVIWEFSESGLMTQTSGDEITAVHLVSSYLDVDVIIIRHNCTTQRTLYSVKFQPDGDLILTAFRKGSDRIILSRV